MVWPLVRRVVASVLLFVVSAGGGGLPIMDGIFFHGPDRLAEAFRPHYEASSASCHGDGCSFRSLAQSRVMGEGPLQVRLVSPLEQLIPAVYAEPALFGNLTLRYLSRAPPSA